MSHQKVYNKEGGRHGKVDFGADRSAPAGSPNLRTSGTNAGRKPGNDLRAGDGKTGAAWIPGNHLQAPGEDPEETVYQVHEGRIIRR